MKISLNAFECHHDDQRWQSKPFRTVDWVRWQMIAGRQNCDPQTPGRLSGLRTSWSGSSFVASDRKKWQTIAAPALSGSKHLPPGAKSYGSLLYLCRQHLQRPSIMRPILSKCARWQEAGLNEEYSHLHRELPGWQMEAESFVTVTQTVPDLIQTFINRFN